MEEWIFNGNDNDWHSHEKHNIWWGKDDEASKRFKKAMRIAPNGSPAPMPFHSNDITVAFRQYQTFTEFQNGEFLWIILALWHYLRQLLRNKAIIVGIWSLGKSKCHFIVRWLHQTLHAILTGEWSNDVFFFIFFKWSQNWGWQRKKMAKKSHLERTIWKHSRSMHSETEIGAIARYVNDSIYNLILMVTLLWNMLEVHRMEKSQKMGFSLAVVHGWPMAKTTVLDKSRTHTIDYILLFIRFFSLSLFLSFSLSLCPCLCRWDACTKFIQKGTSQKIISNNRND